MKYQSMQIQEWVRNGLSGDYGLRTHDTIEAAVAAAKVHDEGCSATLIVWGEAWAIDDEDDQADPILLYSGESVSRGDA